MGEDKLTPMMRQYMKIKKENKDTLLLFRMGDFYEMFFEDAKKASSILNITLTSRGKVKGEKIPMCGIPHHAAEVYLNRLIKAGKRVAICDQMEDPKLAKGIVRREVTRVVSPGTVLSDTMLEEKSSNYLVSVRINDKKAGLAFVDLSTGEFRLTEVSMGRDLSDEIARLNPSEIIFPSEDEKIKIALNSEVQTSYTPFDDWAFSFDNSYRVLTEHFNTHSLEGFGCEGSKLAVGAAGAVILYLKETQKAALEHITRIGAYQISDFMLLDKNTRRNLELNRNLMEGGRRGSLLGVLDYSSTAMGGRLLAGWINQPLIDRERIIERQDGVEEFFKNHMSKEQVRKSLKGIQDIERLIGRISCNQASPRDLVALKSSLSIVPEIKNLLGEFGSNILVDIRENLDEVRDVVDLVDRTIGDEPSTGLKDGGIIRTGYNKEVDELREISKSGKGWIAKLQAEEIQKTGINSLKVGYNQVFGYYIEVTKSNLKLVPEDYIRKQTLVNAERFITPALKEYEMKILNAEEKLKEKEYALFIEVRNSIAKHIPRIQRSANLLAVIDVLVSLAEAARAHGYIRPEMADEKVILIKDGRHPVLDLLMTDESFVPNDCYLDNNEQRIVIITGPNMAGKSTYIRQVALIVLMAQVGSFVPAKEAKIGIVDRIFTRIGASDDLVRGRSTFMVEMNETANILNNATADSLIILDEIGRGTSTFDGISIAWAVTSYMTKLNCKCLFATHYHELTEISLQYNCIKNFNVAVKEWKDKIVFLRKVIEGSADKSYGIHVARLAGIPKEIVEHAKDILVELEEGSLKRDWKPRFSVERNGDGGIGQDSQLNLFEIKPDPMLEEIKGLDIENMSPMEALKKLEEIKKKLH